MIWLSPMASGAPRRRPERYWLVLHSITVSPPSKGPLTTAGGKPSVLSVSAPRSSRALSRGERGLFLSCSSPSTWTGIPREARRGRERYSVVPLFPASICRLSRPVKADVASTVASPFSLNVTIAPISSTALIHDEVSSEIRG